MKLLYAVVVALLLTGCGGGGGDSAGGGTGGGTGGGSGGGTGGGNTDPLAQYINVNSLYLGNKNNAQVNSASLPAFFDYLSFVAPELLPDYVDSDAEGFLDGVCPEGGSVNVDVAASATEVKLSFSNCKDDGIIYDGVMTGRILAKNSLDDVTEAQFIFQDLTVRSSFGSYVMRGTIHEKIAATSCPDSTITFNLLLNGQNNQQIFFNDFKFRRAGSPSQSCGDDGIHLSGKIFDSSLGLMSYQTTEAFKLDTMLVPPEKGRLVLTGAANSSVVWSVNSYERSRIQDSYYRTEIDSDGDQIFETSYQYIKGLFSHELLTSFVDADQDGMQDAWELLVGLSPTNPADALLDTDGDGYTNLAEFKYLGHPLEAVIKASVTDLNLWPQHNSYSYNETMSASFTLTNTSDVDALAVVIRLTASKAKFSAAENCELAQNDMQLTCRYQTLRAGQKMSPSYKLIEATATTEGWQEQISVDVSSLSFDPDLADNKVVLNLSKAKANTDYVISSRISNGPAYNFIGLPGDSIDYEFWLSNQADKPAGSRLQLELPALLSATQMTCFDSASQNWLSCDLGKGWPLQSDALQVRFTLKADQQGVGQLKLTVLNDNFSNKQLKVFQLPVVVGESSQLLQDLIDAAADGSTVVAPAGVYIGALDLTSKNTRLESVAGAKQSFLIAKHWRFGDAPVYVRLAKGSDLKGFTIANNVLIEDAGSVIEQNHFGKTDWYLDGVSISSGHSMTFRQNKLFAAYVNTGIGGSPAVVSGCSGISLYGQNGPTEVIVENNLFVGPLVYSQEVNSRCSASAVSAVGQVNLKFNHNTVSGYVSALSTQHSVDTDSATVQIGNNIFNANTYALSTGWTVQEPKQFVLEVKNNLYWSNYQDYKGLTAHLQEITKISANPLLNADGKLNSGSQAIDGAVELGLTTDVNGVVRPVDGNGDGIAAADVGAVEFQP